jgi:hypothetical protein
MIFQASPLRPLIFRGTLDALGLSLKVMPAAMLDRDAIPTGVVSCLTDAYRATCPSSRILPCCFAFRLTPSRLFSPSPRAVSEAFTVQPITMALLSHVSYDNASERTP